jgi:hypothetical protein
VAFDMNAHAMPGPSVSSPPLGTTNTCTRMLDAIQSYAVYNLALSDNLGQVKLLEFVSRSSRLSNHGFGGIIPTALEEFK